MQIAIVLYPGITALDAIGPYEVLRYLPDSEIRFLHHAVGPVMTDSGVLTLGASHTFEQTPAPDFLLVPGSENDTGSAAAADRGREGLSPSPPSEPCVRFSRTRLSSWWFQHRDWLARAWASVIVKSPISAKKAFGHWR